MEQRHEDIDSLALMIRSQREEIQKYRWIESEKIGHDIGFERAEREWRREHSRDWRAWLRKQGFMHPIVDLVWSQQEEIERFKWLESEQRGYDVGWEQAVREWSQKHYEAWRQNMMEGGSPMGITAEPASPSRRRPLRAEHRSNISAALKEWWKIRRNQGQN